MTSIARTSSGNARGCLSKLSHEYSRDQTDWFDRTTEEVRVENDRNDGHMTGTMRRIV